MVCAAVWPSAALGRAPDPLPPLRIPLEPIGYQTMQSNFLLGGSSMLTLHFVDDTHLLVTFALRRLMVREVDDPAGDLDRTIGAYLLELPTGRVVAKTEWRVHDHGQYLWDLGRGRFVLRIRNRLTVFAPLAARPERAFEQWPFLWLQRQIKGLLVSAEGDLLTLETEDLTDKSRDDAPVDIDEPLRSPTPIQINFYRISDAMPSEASPIVRAAGVVRSRAAIDLPVTSSGFMDVLSGGRNQWLFNFDTHDGKVNELPEWDSTCYPRVTFVSRSEFVAFGCKSGTDKLDIAGFNLRGDEMWQQNFFDSHLHPTFAFAPEAGRFALERVIVTSSADPALGLSPSQVTSETVQVYQTESGRQLLKVDCTPAQLAGQNFSLSANGLKLAVVQETEVFHKATKDEEAYTSRSAAIMVYPLPPLTPQDVVAVNAARKYAPEQSDALIDMSSGGNKMNSGGAGMNSANAVPAVVSDVLTIGDSGGSAVGSAPSASGPAPVAMVGDPVPDAPRKPPSLYGPGESPNGRQPQVAPDKPE